MMGLEQMQLNKDYWIFTYDDCNLPTNDNHLSKAEIDKCNDYKFSADKEKYLIRHTALRTLLDKPDCYYNNNGQLLIQNHDNNISISHTNEHFAIALNQNKKVGIDIETIEILETPLENIKIFLTDEEAKYFQGHPNQNELFYKFWTAKEAILKAMGKGFLKDPKEIELELENDRLIPLQQNINLTQKLNNNLCIAIATLLD